MPMCKSCVHSGPALSGLEFKNTRLKELAETLRKTLKSEDFNSFWASTHRRNVIS